MAHIAPDRLILQLSDDELEKFVREWALRRSGSVEVKLLSGAGDRGRDVVGYHTTKRDEGPWDNYQCKQYGSTLPTAIGLLDIGKVLYYAYRGEFTAPAAFFFVAPRGVNRTLRRLLLKPSEFQATLMNDWATYCAGKIVAGQHIPLDAGLRAFIEAWDFSRIRSLSVHDLLDDPVSQPLMATWFDLDPGPPPAGVVPAEVEQREMPYIEQLLDAYSERDGHTFANHADAKEHAEYGPHLDMQRERFFDADAFSRFYRDNTMSEQIDALRRDMFHGTAETHRLDHPDALARVDAVMTQAANVQPAGALFRYARVPVKQVPSFRQRRSTDMAPTEEMTEDSTPVLFNGALETGVRAVVVLDAAYPRSFDIAKLTWCDHLVVHTADIDGPASLHPDIPQRTGELLVRRRLVEDGVNLMRRLHLINATADAGGIRYQASEEASAFVEALRTEYAQGLKQRAVWLAGYLAERSDAALAELISERIGRWAVEFQGEANTSGGTT